MSSQISLTAIFGMERMTYTHVVPFQLYPTITWHLDQFLVLFLVATSFIRPNNPLFFSPSVSNFAWPSSTWARAWLVFSCLSCCEHQKIRKAMVGPGSSRICVLGSRSSTRQRTHSRHSHQQCYSTHRNSHCPPQLRFFLCISNQRSSLLYLISLSQQWVYHTDIQKYSVLSL